MTYRQAKARAVKDIADAQRLLVLETVRNMRRRYATYRRHHALDQRGAIYQSPALQFHEWLKAHSFESTYLNKGIGAHEMPVRQLWARALIKEAASTTMGAHQTTEWFLEALGKELTKWTPHYVVTVHDNTTNSDFFTASPSLYFKVKLLR